MAPPNGNFVELNLGPLYVGSGAFLPLNLGVDWWEDEPDPPDPVIRGLSRAVDLRWRGRSRAILRALSTGWSAAATLHREALVPWSPAAGVARAFSLPWSSPERLPHEAEFRWNGQMPSLSRTMRMPWLSRPLVERGLHASWRQQRLLHGQATAVEWQAPGLGSASLNVRFRAQLPRLHPETAMRWRVPALRRWQRWIPWGVAKPVPWVVVPRPDPKPEPPPPWTPADGRYVGLNLGCAVVDVPGLAPLNLGINACYAVRPRRRTYIVINDVSVVRLPDRAPIGVLDLAISGGADAWGWTLDMTLADAAALALLQPGSGGPRQVEVNLNGYRWTFIVEAYSGTRDHQQQGIRVGGRSRTALLAAPYAPARTKVSDTERSAAQLVDEELANTGFTADYATVDWLVPPGAWYYDATTPMDAIARVAEASGAVVQSHPENLTLEVRPRYPHSPWAWPDTTPDHVLVDDVVITESLQVRSAPLYNAVVVTGELAGKGVTATVTRAGEGADLYAPQASSPLINTDAVAIERGRNVLGDRGEQAAIDHTVPLFAGPVLPGQIGRVLPLELVRVESAGGTWHGQCTAVRIDVRVDNNATVVEQTITLERHYSDAD